MKCKKCKTKKREPYSMFCFDCKIQSKEEKRIRKEKWEELHNEGKTFEEIGKMYGVTRQRVYTAIQELKINGLISRSEKYKKELLEECYSIIKEINRQKRLGYFY